jgi:hypothetical protein
MTEVPNLQGPLCFGIMVLTTNVATLLQCFNSCRYWEVLNLIDIWHWQCVCDVEDASLRFVSQLLPYPWYFATKKLYSRFMDKRSTTCEISHAILLFSSLNTLMLYKLHSKRVWNIVNWNNSYLFAISNSLNHDFLTYVVILDRV